MFTETRRRSCLRLQPFQPGARALHTRQFQGQPSRCSLRVAPNLFAIRSGIRRRTETSSHPSDSTRRGLPFPPFSKSAVQERPLCPPLGALNSLNLGLDIHYQNLLPQKGRNSGVSRCVAKWTFRLVQHLVESGSLLPFAAYAFNVCIGPLSTAKRRKRNRRACGNTLMRGP
jgi:hypothetical protein